MSPELALHHSGTSVDYSRSPDQPKYNTGGDCAKAYMLGTMIPSGPSLEASLFGDNLLPRLQAPPLVQNECFPPLPMTPRFSPDFSPKGRAEVWLLNQLLMRHLGQAPLDLKAWGLERSHLPPLTWHINETGTAAPQCTRHSEGEAAQSQVHRNSEILLGAVLRAPELRNVC